MKTFPSVKEVKKLILKEFGKSGLDFVPTCYACQIWRAFESYCWLVGEIQREQKEK